MCLVQWTVCQYIINTHIRHRAGVEDEMAPERHPASRHGPPLWSVESSDENIYTLLLYSCERTCSAFFVLTYCILIMAPGNDISVSCYPGPQESHWWNTGFLCEPKGTNWISCFHPQLVTLWAISNWINVEQRESIEVLCVITVQDSRPSCWRTSNPVQSDTSPSHDVSICHTWIHPTMCTLIMWLQYV